MESAWKTYFPGKKFIRKQTLLNAVSSSSALPQVKRDPEEDPNWQATNVASANLAKETGQSLPVVVAASPAAPVKKRKTSTPKKKKDDAAAQTPIIRTAAYSPPAEVPVEKAPTAPEQIEIQTLEQHKRRDNQVQLFELGIESMHRATSDMIIRQPPAVEVLSYCSRFKDEMPWFAAVQQAVAENPDITYPKTPVYSRAFLQTFFRQPDPKCPWERPCLNLDREPVQGERYIRCIAHRLSEEHLGKDKAFRLRELLSPKQEIDITNALESKKQDPRIFLEPIPEICVMCHIYLTTEKCFDDEADKHRQRRSDHTSQIERATRKITRIHNKFMVDIDKPGEYNRRILLVSDRVDFGIWGPFPMWNKNNYVPCKKFGSLMGFEESPNLLFQQARISSQPAESSVPNKSSQSNPTSGGQKLINSRP
jgi:hypothetical protein